MLVNEELRSITDHNIILKRINTFENQVILVDGQGRSGKNLMAVLLSSMARVEKMRLDSHLDYIPRYWALGKISDDAAVTALKLEYDENLYYSSISRDINFRFDDYSGVFKQANKWTYIKRMFQSAKTVTAIRNDAYILQEMTHNGIQFFDLHLMALGNRLKMIHLIRNPVRNIYEQNKRGLGERISNDPSELQLTYELQGKIYPYTALGVEEYYRDANPLEKLVTTVAATTSNNVRDILKNKTYWGDKLLLIDFEEFVSNPNPHLIKIEKFVESKFTKKTRSILKRENCPRKVDKGQESDMYKMICENIRPEYIALLDRSTRDYTMIKEEYCTI